MRFFDTHFHLLPDDDLKEMVTRAVDKDVSGMMLAGLPIQELHSTLERISSFPNVYAAVGVHPHEAANFSGKREDFKIVATNSKIKAIGEIGLDYYYENSEPEIQRSVFASFLDLARETNLPAIIHCREIDFR